MHQKQDIDTGTFLTIGNDSTNGLVASSGTDTFVGIDAKVTQTGTAGYTGLNINVTETSTGSGVHQILQTSVGGISKFHVNSDGTATHANDLTVTTGTNTYVQTDELLVDLSGAGLGTIHLPLVIGKIEASVLPIEYGLSTYDNLIIWDYSDNDEPTIIAAKTDFSASLQINFYLADEYIGIDCDLHPDSDDDYDLGSASLQWQDLFLSATATVGTLTDGTTTLTAGTMNSVLFTDKIKFTQADGNEYIDSLTDGYIDYGATTAHRFSADIFPATDDTYYLGKNDDDSPLAWKGLVLKDTTNGKYYRIEITNGSIVATDLTD